MKNGHRLLISTAIGQALGLRGFTPAIEVSMDFNDKLRVQREHDAKHPSKRELKRMKGRKK